MHEYVDNILEKKIALVSLAIIMVLTGVTFGIGFGFQKHPQLLTHSKLLHPRSHPLSTATYLLQINTLLQIPKIYNMLSYFE